MRQHRVTDPRSRQPQRVRDVGDVRSETLKLPGKLVQHCPPVSVAHRCAPLGEIGVVGLEQLNTSFDQRLVLLAPSRSEGRQVVTCDEEITSFDRDFNGLR